MTIPSRQLFGVERWWRTRLRAVRIETHAHARVSLFIHSARKGIWFAAKTSSKKNTFVH